VRTFWKSEESLVHSASAWAAFVVATEGASSQGESSVSCVEEDMNDLIEKKRKDLSGVARVFSRLSTRLWYLTNQLVLL
jgi:hypothetical protein